MGQTWGRTRRLGTIGVLAVLIAGAGVAAVCADEPRPLEELRTALAGDDGNERRKAVEGLGEYRRADVVELLLQTYRNEGQDSFGVRAACAVALGRTGHPAAAEALAVVVTDPDYWVRRQGAKALGQLPGDAATQVLLHVAEDPDPRVRAAAVSALAGRFGTAKTLRKAYGDPKPLVAAAALEALAVTDHLEAPALLTRALDEGPWQVRFRAASLLARRGDPRGFAVLTEAVRNGRHVGVALREVARVGPEAVAPLADLHAAADPDLGKRIFAALEQMEGSAATEFFAQLAGRAATSAAERVQAAVVLFDRRDTLTERQVDRVAQLLDREDPNLSAVVLQILSERGAAEYLPRVAPLVRHDNKVVRHFSLTNLRRYGGARYETTFIEALGDANGANVRLALAALAESGTLQALPAVRALAEQRKYRRYALAAVESIEARTP